jgi:DUF4097 and DUF4098 domain-containing protein YvlB
VSNGRPRRSIFGGLLLILIGGVLLAGNFYPEVRFWSFFARFWPAILILWGLAKLFDYFASQRTGDATPPAFTAGEFFLLFFLLILGAGVSITKEGINRGIFTEMGDFPGFVNRYSYTEEAALKFAKPDATIVINNSRGNIRIIPEDTREIRVVAQKQVLIFGNEAEAKERATQTRIEIREVSGGYEIRRVDAPTENNRGRVTMDFEIHLPRQASLNAKIVRGDLTLGGLQGTISIDAQRSDVEVRDAGKDVDVRIRTGNVRVTKVAGNVRLDGSGDEIGVTDVKGEAIVQGEFSGPIRLTNVARGGKFVSNRTDLTFGPLPGRLELGGGELEITDSAGSVDVTTREKDIRLENIAGRVKIVNRRGNIELRFKNPPKEELDVMNESGNIELTLPSAASFEIAASSQNGEVDSEFSDPGLKKTEDRDNARLEGKVGARGPQIKVKTTYGTVSLRKTT